MMMINAPLVLALVLLFCLASTSLGQQQQARPLTRLECQKLAAVEGNCMRDEMVQHCPSACNRQHELDLQEKFGHSPITSFYDLSATDIDGNEVNFQSFRNKMVLITNVASFCGLTKDHYAELQQLHSNHKNTNFEIVLFPCNQFGGQEPGSSEEIKSYVANQLGGMHFTIMSKIDVNGHKTHSVYRFLKQTAGPPRIEWNFGTYYLITRQGNVSSHSGTSPMKFDETIAVGNMDIFGAAAANTKRG